MNDLNPPTSPLPETVSASPSALGTEILWGKRLLLRQHWARGERPGAEEFFEAGMDREAQLRLILAELLLREEYSEKIDLDELLQRFPQFEAELRRQIDLLQMISNERQNTLTQPSTRMPHAVASIHIPGYQVRELIARGGMGAVYLAWEEKLQRLVALKILLQGDARSFEKLERFRSEAQAIAQLHHPNVVQIYQVGEWFPPGSTQPSPFFAMEYCSKGDLARHLAKNPQKPLWAAQQIVLLARAMHHAHQAGILHRDLKPSNILLADDEQPKISDFGLAKQLHSEHDLTATQVVLGTPAYMAPEQAFGQKKLLGPQVDIYALGAILYEMLTGRPPFQGANPMEVLDQVRKTDPVPPRSIVPSIPVDLETITLKCLSKSPPDRYASAADLADDLDRFLAGRPTLARPLSLWGHTLRWMQRNQAISTLIAVSLTTLLLLVGLTSWYLARLGTAERERQAAQRSVQVQHYFELLAQISERAARRSAGWTWKNLEAIREAVAIQQVHQVQPPEESELLLRSAALEALIAVDARDQTLLLPRRRFDSLAWSPDGKWLALGGRSFILFPWCDVYLVDARDLSRVRLISVWCNWGIETKPLKFFPNVVHSLAFSPDGRWLAFALRTAEAFVIDLHDPQFAVTRLKPEKPVPYGKVVFNATSQTLLWWGDHETLYLQTGTWQALHRQTFPEQLQCVQADNCDGFDLANIDRRWAVNARGQLLHPARDIRLIPLGQLADGRQLVLEDYDRLAVRDSSLRSGYALLAPRRRTTHDAPLVAAWDRRGHLAVSFDSPNRLARLWDVPSASLVCDLYLPGSPGIQACAMAPDGSQFALLEYLGARVYEIRPRPEFDFTAMQTGEVINLSTHPQYGWIATKAKSAEEKVHIVRVLEPGRESALSYRSFLPPLANVRVSPMVLTGQKTPSVLEIGSAARKATLAQEQLFSPQPPPCTTIGPNQIYADLHIGQEGKLWTVSNQLHQIDTKGQIQLSWKNELSDRIGNNPGIYAVHSRDNLVAVGYRDGSATVLREQEKKLSLLYRYKSTDVPTTKVLLAANSPTLFVGRINGTIEIHDLESRECVHTTKVHPTEITALVQTPEGRLLISGTLQGEIAFWKYAEQRLTLLARYQGPPQRCHLALAADGVTLYSLHERDHGVRVWHLPKIFARWNEFGLGGDLPVLTERPLPPVPLPTPPISSLATTDQTPANGWNTQRYRLTGFLGPLPALLDPTIEVTPAKRPVASRLVTDAGYSCRWTGWLVPPKPGRYKLRLQSNAPATLTLDGKRCIEFLAAGNNDWSFETELQVKPYAVCVDAPELSLQGELHLRWSGPDLAPDTPLGVPYVFRDAQLAQGQARTASRTR